MEEIMETNLHVGFMVSGQGDLVNGLTRGYCPVRCSNRVTSAICPAVTIELMKEHLVVTIGVPLSGSSIVPNILPSKEPMSINLCMTVAPQTP